MRCAIVFRGEGKRLKNEEKAAYAALSGLLAVYFQPKAWVDEQVALLWLEQFVSETSVIQSDRLLGMDRHGPQMTSRFRARSTQANIVPLYTPPDCTDVTAPCDHHVFARMKHIINTFYEAELEINHSLWCNPPSHGGLHAYQRRIYLATWTALAWQILRSDDAFLRSAFISTGCLLAKDGSEDHLIKVHGIDNYNFNIN